jgi:hypothetical protein
VFDDKPMVAPIHPALALHVAALNAWDNFAEDGLGVLGLGLLAAVDELGKRVAVQPAPIRLVGMHYRPGRPLTEGGVTVWLADPGRVRAATDRETAPLQVAFGLLQSAVIGQVLNRVADRPPTTAYDLTLRAVGAGSRLSWFRRGGSPPAWPPVAQRTALADLDAGGVVVGPAQPIQQGGDELLAWWSIGATSGITAGRVQRPGVIAQAAVALGPAVDAASLDSMLASLHDLHVATRWLLTLGDADLGVLRDLVPGACAATPLVAELLRAGAPADFVAPAFPAFCQPVAGS